MNINLKQIESYKFVMQRIALDFVSQNFSDNTTQEQGRRGKNLCLW